jgi:hypothetical protein
MKKDRLIKIILALYRVTEFFPKKEPLKFFLREKSIQIFDNAILFFSKNDLNINEQQREPYLKNIFKDINQLQSYFEVAEKQNWVKRENFLVLKREYDNLIEEIKEETREESRGELNEKIRENLKGEIGEEIKEEIGEETEKNLKKQVSETAIVFRVSDNEKIDLVRKGGVLNYALSSEKESGLYSCRSPQGQGVGFSNEVKILTKNLTESENNVEVLNGFKNERQKKILKFLQEKKQAQVKDLKKMFPRFTKRTLRRDFDYLLKAGTIKRIGQTNRTLYQLK